MILPPWQSGTVAVPVGEILPQLLSLIPTVASGVVVLWKRPALPFPRLWTGALIGISFAVARHACAIEYLLTGARPWLHAYNVFLGLVPVTMLLVSWGVVRTFELQREQVSKLEARYREALGELERRLEI